MEYFCSSWCLCTLSRENCWQKKKRALSTVRGGGARVAKRKNLFGVPSRFNSWPRTSCQSKNPSPVAARPKLKITLWLVWANMSLFRSHKRILYMHWKKRLLSRAFSSLDSIRIASMLLISVACCKFDQLWCDLLSKLSLIPFESNFLHKLLHKYQCGVFHNN